MSHNNLIGIIQYHHCQISTEWPSTLSRGRRRAGELLCLLRGIVVGKKKSFGFNHKIMIKIQKSPPSIKVTRKPNGLRESE